MPYIPKQHEKYELLPMCRKNGGEVFEYPSSLMSQLEELGIHHLDPYGYDSYEAYYAELDKKKSEVDDETIKALIEKFKTCMVELNQKENWSVLKYLGEDTDTLLGLTKGQYYYWACTKENASYKGVIDDEEYTAYLYPTEVTLWEIVEDPTGMAYRTIYEGKDSISIKEHDNLICQAKILVNSSVRWMPYDNRNTIGMKGSENGTIIADEEFDNSARITMEECPQYFAITCGIYGEMIHTAFCEKKDSEEKYKLMKEDLREFLLEEMSDEEKCAFYDDFTSKY